MTLNPNNPYHRRLDGNKLETVKVCCRQETEITLKK